MNGYNMGMTYGCGGPCACRQMGQQTAPGYGRSQNTQMMTPYAQQQMGTQTMPTAGRQQTATYAQQSMMSAAPTDMTSLESVAPATLDTTAYMAGLLKTFIGERVRVSI
jgi:hypothetical protein